MSNDDYKKQKLKRKLKQLNDEMNETSKDGKIYFTYLMAYQSSLTMFVLFVLFLFFQTFGLTTATNVIVSLSITLILFGSIVRFFPEIHKAGKEKYIKEQLEHYEKNL